LGGITRLGALADGVKAPIEGVAADRELSLLRDRFDEAGDAGIASGPAADMFSVSVWSPCLTLALRRSARNLCSLKTFPSMALCDSGVGGRKGGGRLEGGMVQISRAVRDGEVACKAGGNRTISNP
jgi:hypothetical protein